MSERSEAADAVLGPEQVGAARTLLFVPGDRPDRFDRACASGADVVVLDLEDAVAAAAKESARSHVAGWLRAGGRALVRVNARGTPWFGEDVRAVRGAGATVLMVPKVEGPADLHALDEAAGGPVAAVALVETARGVLEAAAICAVPTVCRVALGHVDLAADLGIDPADDEALLGARSMLVLASRAAGLPAPIDGVTVAVADPDALARDTRRARRLGFTGRLCIHPRQVGPVAAGLAPTEAEVAWARRVLDLDAALGVVDGELVDEPVLRRARLLLQRAGASGRPG